MRGEGGAHVIKVSIFAFCMLYEFSFREKHVNCSKYCTYLTGKREVVTSESIILSSENYPICLLQVSEYFLRTILYQWFCWHELLITCTTHYFTGAVVCCSCHFCSGLNGGSDHAHHYTHSFHCRVQNATIPCRSQELHPFLSVMYFFLPPFSTNYFSILSHLVLPSISWSTFQSCCSQIRI